MMRRLVKILKYLLLSLMVLAIGFALYLYSVASVEPPQLSDFSVTHLSAKKIGEHAFTINNNWIRKSNNGWWEMYVEGEPFERGVINGKLSEHLVYYQEKAFYEQICELVPSGFYRKFLKYFIAFFNRNMDENLTEEQKLEIYGVSLSASPEFDEIGPAYQRFMNYHAAHDIGHALQNLALVGCTSFATWNGRSHDSSLIVSRVFDFYVGDKFAENKIVKFCKPSEGHPFMSVSWGGMTGVISGMNMEGLTVTINAAPSDWPAGSATPVSLLAREILQYAANIDDAVKIAKSRKTFVSESFLVASANDKRAVVIEKTPESIAVYDSNKDYITCTNHYQSEAFQSQPLNQAHMSEGASAYRQQRLEQLLGENIKNTPEKSVEILRDRYGIDGAFIGNGNEKAINQLICHHAIVFEPEKSTVWLSTEPWQLGAFVSYDLKKIFGMEGLQEDAEIAASLAIPPDPFLKESAFSDFVSFRKLKEQFMGNEKIDPEKIVALNPEYYHAYVLAGDYLFKMKDFAKASEYYSMALNKVVATVKEENYIKKQIQECSKRK